MELGRKMLEFRAKNNLTQTQLANMLGVDVNTVYRTESGKTQPTKRNAIKYENKMKEYEVKKNENVSL